MNFNSMEDEVLCGFTVTGRQKQVNMVYLDLLREFGRLCEKAGITWWIYFGTLLGAVRHKGFIPWDDDVDLMIPRKDFDRLLKMTNEEFGAEGPYFLQNPVNDPHYYQPLLRFRRSDTAAIMDYDLVTLKEHPEEADYNMGMCLSLFPLDDCPKSDFMRVIRKKIAYVLLGIYYRGSCPASEKPLFHKICRAVGKLIGFQNIMTMIQACFRVRHPNGKNVNCVDGFYPARHLWKAEDFAETVYLPFEDLQLPAPVGWDDLLTDRYGSYMDFPPPEQRVYKHDGYLTAERPYTEVIKDLDTVAEYLEN